MSDYGKITRRPDGSFVIRRRGWPFHVPDHGEFRGLFSEIAAYARARPEMVEMEQAAPGQPGQAEDPAEARRAEIRAELAEIDRRSVRPLRAEAEGLATPEDRASLAGLEARARKLRDELAGAGEIAI